MRSIAVVPCGKAKIWKTSPHLGAVAARDVYVGSFAVATRRYAEAFFSTWFILSARHGFLRPDDLVPGPYEASFAQGTATITDRQLHTQATKLTLTAGTELVVVAGKAYVAAVRRAVDKTGATVKAPLLGRRGIGEMLAALKAAREQGRPL